MTFHVMFYNRVDYIISLNFKMFKKRAIKEEQRLDLYQQEKEQKINQSNHVDNNN